MAVCSQQILSISIKSLLRFNEAAVYRIPQSISFNLYKTTIFKKIHSTQKQHRQDAINIKSC